MADFVAVLKKTLDGMGETTPELRKRVYDKARSTIAAKLAAIQPLPPAAVAERQKRALEDAISTVEAGYAAPEPVPAAIDDPLAELENIFSSIDRNKNQSSHSRPAAKVEPSWQPAPPATRKEAPPEPEPGSPPMASDVPAAADADHVERAAEGATFPNEIGPADDEDAQAHTIAERRPARDRNSHGALIAGAIALLVLGGGFYGIWLNAGAFKDMFGSDNPQTATAPATTAPETPAKPADDVAAPPAAPAAAPAESTEPPKFTQRLTPEGTETDPGPASGETGIGEGTSVVALTTQPPALSASAPAGTGPASPTETPAAPGQPAEGPALAVGQKAIYYEERTNVSQGSAEPGNIVWSLVQESPGGDLPLEPAIRAEATVPGKDVQLRMTIRRNADQTLPASHIIEMIFLTPDGFEGGGIDNILRVAMKTSEQDAGSPLIGIPAKIADGFFLVALNDTKADEAANLTLLRNQQWIDVPIVYKSGRRALLTMEKGIPGDKVFDEAIKAWQANTAAD